MVVFKSYTDSSPGNASHTTLNARLDVEEFESLGLPTNIYSEYGYCWYSKLLN